MRFPIIILLSLLTISLSAQTAFDGLRWSTFDVTGTARNMGVGSAISGLGADFSTLSTNPAGLGAYRYSEIIISPAFNISNATALLRNNDNDAIKNTGNQFLLGSLGGVFVGRPKGANWSNFNFAFGLNQTANFNQQFIFEGSSLGSITDRFLEQVNAGEFFEFESDVAAQAEAIYDLDGDNIWTSDFELVPNALVPKEQAVTRKGSIQELLFSIGGNYREKLLFGLSVGFPFINYEENKVYGENDPDDVVPLFENLTFEESLITTGAGINAKLGLIYMITNKIRVGAAVHTPTGFSLEDTFTTNMDYVFNDNDIIQGRGESPEGLFNYRLRTPWRFIGGAGFILGKTGFISSEVEWVNYGNATFNLTSDSDNPDDVAYEAELNTQIDDRFQSGLNWRVGGELAINPFRLRAGIGLGFSPNADTDELDQTYSLGVGYRRGKFFADAAYRIAILEEDYIPYLTSIAPEQNVSVDYNDQRILLTIGFKL